MAGVLDFEEKSFIDFSEMQFIRHYIFPVLISARKIKNNLIEVFKI